jgi:hypothetical protein
MKYINPALFLFMLLILTACSDTHSPELVESAVVPVANIPTGTLTVTSEPQLTATETLTVAPSPTLFLSPTVITENFELAKSGYDIADVRLSFPREDMVIINFKYRLDESRKSKDTYLYMTVPPQCADDDNKNSPPQFLTKRLEGEAKFEFKMTLQGVCDADGIEFIFQPAPGSDVKPPLYREYVSQPYHLVRNFPTVNSDTLKLENIKFTPNSNWGGEFTFDYAMSEEIPLPLEQYIFVMNGFGPGQTCFFWSGGPRLEQHSGKYRLNMNLYQDLAGPYQNCLKGMDKFTYTSLSLSVLDTIADRWVYHQELNIPITVLKNP